MVSFEVEDDALSEHSSLRSPASSGRSGMTLLSSLNASFISCECASQSGERQRAQERRRERASDSGAVQEGNEAGIEWKKNRSTATAAAAARERERKGKEEKRKEGKRTDKRQIR